MRGATNLKVEIHNETRWSRKYKMLQNLIRIRSDLIEASFHQDSGIEISYSTVY